MQVIKSEDVKSDFSELKKKWEDILRKYYINNKTLNPEYTIKVSCPHCNLKDIESSFDLNGFTHNICSNCKTLFVSPRLNDICIEELYSDEYYNEIYTRSMLPVFEKRKKLIGQRKFAQVISFHDENMKGRVLDIGAGIGEVIDVFKDEGWVTHAIEMNPVAAEWLSGRGYNEVFLGSLDDYTTDKKFDIIMAWGVIEHLVAADDFLNRVNNLLAPNGLLISEVPHGQCLLVDFVRKTGTDPKRILMGEQHIVLYSKKAYIELHQRNGFNQVHIQTNGLDCDTIFKEKGISVSDEILANLQECVDEKMYGDLLRGFWRKIDS